MTDKLIEALERIEPYHPDASHVPPDYRDGFNTCFTMMKLALDFHRSQQESSPPAAKGVEAYVDGAALQWLNDPKRSSIATITTGLRRSPFDGAVALYTSPAPSESAAKDAARLDYIQERGMGVGLAPYGYDEEGTQLFAFCVGGYAHAVDRDIRTAIDQAVALSRGGK